MADVPAILQKVREQVSAGGFAQAHALLAKLLPRHKDNPNVNAAMCRLLTAERRFEEALTYARRAVRAAPGDANMLTNLANVLTVLDRTDESIPIYDQVLQIDPSRRAVRAAYCALLLKEHRAVEAGAAAQVGLDRVPGDGEFMSVVAQASREGGRIDMALELLRRCVALHPRELKPAILLANTTNYVDVPAEETLRLHLALEALVPGRPSPPAPVALGGRRLRVGVLSADLRGHSVAHFIEPVLREFDRQRFEFVCFSDAVKEDEHSRRLAGFATGWHRTATMRDEEHDAFVRAQRIDVVLDLAGLTSGGRYEVLKLRPAPVQVTYCGYPNTTGLSTVDYRIVDAVTDPPGYEERCAEKLLRLYPCFLCFTPLKGAPDLAEPPCVRDPSTPITFGSFNALYKLSDRTVRLWARVLNAVPGSRLALKNKSQSHPAVQADIRDRFAEAGVDPSRLDLLSWVGGDADPLRAYDRIDIALDPVPYNGTTTTCEALLCGVPVVVEEGATHAGRVGASLLSTIGRTEYIAKNEDGYVRIAAGLAADRDGLRRLRPQLRADLLASPLCDAKGFTRKFEAALMHAWHEKTGL